MGGRKSYSNKNYLGSSKAVKKEVKTLDEFFDVRENPENIAVQNIKVAINATKPIKYSVYSLKLFSIIARDLKDLRKISDKNALKEEISKRWSSVKKKEKLRINKEAEKIIIESAVRTVGGRR